jgi:hypothetical protein
VWLRGRASIMFWGVGCICSLHYSVFISLKLLSLMEVSRRVKKFRLSWWFFVPCYSSSDLVFLMVDRRWSRILVRFLSRWLGSVFILLYIMSRLISCMRWSTMIWIGFSFMCSLTEGWILLYIISRGVNWMVEIAFPVWAVMTCVRLCPSCVHRSAEYSSQP